MNIVSKLINFSNSVIDGNEHEAVLLVNELLEDVNKINTFQFKSICDLDPQFFQKLIFLIAYVTISHNKSEVKFTTYQLMRFQFLVTRIVYLSNKNDLNSAMNLVLQLGSDNQISSERIISAFLMCNGESSGIQQSDFLFSQAIHLYIPTLFMLVWACLGTRIGMSNREFALTQLAKVDIPYQCIPIELLHGPFMHSAYAYADNKNEFKYNVNKALRKVYSKYDVDTQIYRRKVIFVVLEQFNASHSVYRVLGPSIQSLRSFFTVVGVGWPSYVSDDSKHLFDDYIELNGELGESSAFQLSQLVMEWLPVCVYYPSIGMAPWTIIFSNIRLASIQIVGIGHGASSYASEIDYFVIEEDISGDQSTFSETLVKLPAGSMPYFKPANVNYPLKFPRCDKSIFDFCVVATSMKINVPFLETCKKIIEACVSKMPLTVYNINFFMGNPDVNIDAAVYTKIIRDILPNAKIFFSQPFQSYIDKLVKCDLMLTPYPFGGMNGLLDCARVGVPAICLKGDHVHESFDAGLWHRMELGEYLVATTVDEYIRLAVDFVLDDRRRELILSKLSDVDFDKLFFSPPSDDFPNFVNYCANNLEKGGYVEH